MTQAKQHLVMCSMCQCAYGATGHHGDWDGWVCGRSKSRLPGCEKLCLVEGNKLVRQWLVEKTEVVLDKGGK